MPLLDVPAQSLQAPSIEERPIDTVPSESEEMLRGDVFVGGISGVSPVIGRLIRNWGSTTMVNAIKGPRRTRNTCVALHPV